MADDLTWMLSRREKSAEVRTGSRTPHNFYYFKGTKSMRIKWAGNIACMKCI
jgi:hypothetical protein